jgi:hypothetical protein
MLRDRQGPWTSLERQGDIHPRDVAWPGLACPSMYVRMSTCMLQRHAICSGRLHLHSSGYYASTTS